MSTITAKSSVSKSKNKQGVAAQAAKSHENIIVQKTFRMAETLKKYPPPAK